MENMGLDGSKMKNGCKHPVAMVNPMLLKTFKMVASIQDDSVRSLDTLPGVHFLRNTPLLR